MKKVDVTLNKNIDNSYEIILGSGILGKVPFILKKLKLGNRYAVITDTNVENLYAKEFLRNFVVEKLDTTLLRFKAGERQKTRETKSILEDELIDLGLGRDTVIVALGGGVVGDVAGFVAATFNRGVSFVQIPTTLLAMVDSSIGGKVAVDHPLGKNLIGSFHQPNKVIIDIDALKTLPKKEIINGLVEVIKHAIIYDPDFFNFLDKNIDNIINLDTKLIEEMIKRSCEIKSEIVGKDEKEYGLRKLLNYGHTIGHAVEALENFAVSHGEAVAMGMVIEAEIAKELKMITEEELGRIKSIINKTGVKIDLPNGISSKDLLKKTLLDKKTVGGKVEYSLPCGIGKAKFGICVNDSVVLKVLK